MAKISGASFLPCAGAVACARRFVVEDCLFQLRSLVSRAAVGSSSAGTSSAFSAKALYGGRSHVQGRAGITISGADGGSDRTTAAAAASYGTDASAAHGSPAATMSAAAASGATAGSWGERYSSAPLGGRNPGSDPNLGLAVWRAARAALSASALYATKRLLHAIKDGDWLRSVFFCRCVFRSFVCRVSVCLFVCQVRDAISISHLSPSRYDRLGLGLSFPFPPPPPPPPRLLLCTNSYARLCSADGTCFEPEAGPHLVEGLAFHQHFFRAGEREACAQEADPSTTPVQTVTMASAPHVRVVGSAACVSSAVVSYVRIDQKGFEFPVTRTQETRVWSLLPAPAGDAAREVEVWNLVHSHRSR